MDWNLVGWLAAAACAFGAASLFARTRVLARQVAEADARAREFRERLKTSEKRFDQRAKQGRQRGEETGELRRKLEKARKRAGQAREEQRADAERARKLEAELHLREADLRAARAENAAPPSEVEKREVEKRPNQPTQAAPALPPPPPAPAPQPVVPEAVLERAEKAEDDARRYAKELGKLRQDLERSRVRQRAESKAYMALRGELEAKKDRLRHQQEELERLRAMKVVLGSPDADESPPEPPAASETGPALDPSGASDTNPG